ncbi:MAG: hypothetical protein QM786_17605 [Breznakibacter sp.]
MKLNNQTLRLLVAGLLGGLAYWFVVKRMVGFDGWPLLHAKLCSDVVVFSFFASGQLALMVANLGTEAFRWHLLITSVNPQAFKRSLFQTLAGMAAGAFTPGRLGEPVGKLIGLPIGKTVHAVSLSLLGSILLNTIIVAAGVLAFGIAWGNGIFVDTGLSGSFGLAVLSSCIIFSIVVWGFKPFMGWMARRFKMHRVLVGLSGYKIPLLLLVTVARYVLFAMQMWWALVFFSQAHATGLLLVLIPVYYVLVTLFPSFFGLDLGIRGSLALMLFGSVISSDGAVLVATFFVWLLNVALPSLVGFAATLFWSGSRIDRPLLFSP